MELASDRPVSLIHEQNTMQQIAGGCSDQVLDHTPPDPTVLRWRSAPSPSSLDRWRVLAAPSVTTPPEARVRAHADNHTDTVTEERQTHTDRQNSWKHWCGTECITTHRIDYPSGFRWASVAHLSEAFSARRVAEAEFLSQLRCDSRFGSRRLLFDHRHTSMRYIPVPRSVIANVTFR